MTTFVSDEEHYDVVLENGVVNKPFDSVMVKANKLEEVIRIVEISTK